MKIAYILFNGVTWLDFIGVYDPISRLKNLEYAPNLSWDICSYTGAVSDNFSLSLLPHKVQPDLSDYDVIIVPGGLGTRQLQHDKNFIQWIRTAESSKYKISVCTGSLILGAAGFLKNRKATTNYLKYEALKPYCEEVVKDRIVEDNDVITAGTVAASIDLGLYLCRKWAGEEAENHIRMRMGL